MVSVHPARWCTSPIGVVPGLGNGVGHGHEVANLPRVCLFISLMYPFWENKLYFFQGLYSGFFTTAGYVAAEWVPTPCCNDACSVGTPNWALWEKGWLKHCKTMISPFLGRFFLLSKRTFFFWRGYTVDASYREGQDIIPGQLSVEFINVGG